MFGRQVERYVIKKKLDGTEVHVQDTSPVVLGKGPFPHTFNMGICKFEYRTSQNHLNDTQIDAISDYVQNVLEPSIKTFADFVRDNMREG